MTSKTCYVINNYHIVDLNADISDVITDMSYTKKNDDMSKLKRYHKSTHPLILYMYIVFICTILILVGFQICVKIQSTFVSYMLCIFGICGSLILTILLLRFFTGIFVICIFRGE